MKGKTVFTLVHTDPDSVDIKVFEKEEDAIERLKELAEYGDMEIYDDYNAEGSENYILIEKHKIN